MIPNPTLARMPVEQFWKFVATGLLNTAAHAAIAVAMIRLGQASLLAANVCAFTAATALSYVINTVWSFSGRIGGATLVRFLIVSVFGLGLAAIISGIAERFDLHYLVGIASVPVFVTPVTFTLHRLWTYR
jgi:putative flippase GtrA